MRIALRIGESIANVALSATKAVASRHRLSSQPKPHYHPSDLAADAAKSDGRLVWANGS